MSWLLIGLAAVTFVVGIVLGGTVLSGHWFWLSNTVFDFIGVLLLMAGLGVRWRIR